MKTVKFDLENLDEYIDYLIEIIQSIDLNSITILTGGNAKGKSLIRKQMTVRIMDDTGKDRVRIAHASQELRTKSRPDLGALSGFAHDLEWLATSYSTIDTIKKALNTENADYFVIDEPEIGMGEELQLGLVDWLNENLPKGCLVICHSRLLVKHLKHDNFINLEGMTYDEWINRVPEKISLDTFEKQSNALFTALQSRMGQYKRNR